MTAATWTGMTPDYPRVYRPPMADRVTIALAGALCVLTAAGMVWLWTRRPDPGFLLLAAALGPPGVALALARLCSATVLSADSIEQRGVLARRRILKAEIAGCRLSRPGRGWVRVALTPRDKDVRPFSVQVYRPDAAFGHWFAGLPDLDRLEKAVAERAQLRDPSLGSTEAERVERLAGFAALAKGANGLGLAVLAWAFLFPLPLPAAVAACALAPAAAFALVAWSRGRLILLPAKNDPRPALAALMCAGLVLPARALFDITLDNWIWSAPPAAVLGGLIVLGGWAFDRRYKARLGTISAFAVGATLYAWGAVCELDRQADFAAPQVFSTRVQDQHVSSGRYTRFVLTLAPLSGQMRPREFAVSRRLYQATPVGGTVCVRSHPGALGLRWLQVRDCPQAAGGA